MVDAQRPLQHGLFVSTNEEDKVWLAFKYENLPIFYFSCGKMGHGVTDYVVLSKEDKEKRDDAFPYSIVLKAKSKLLGKEFIQLGRAYKKKRCPSVIILVVIWRIMKDYIEKIMVVTPIDEWECGGEDD